MDTETEKVLSPEELQDYKERYRSALTDFIDNFDITDGPYPSDPISLDGEIMQDFRSLEELTAEEKVVIRDVLYEELGIDPLGPEFLVRVYQSETARVATDPGIIDVRVFKTNREDVFLQEILSPDGEVRYMVGPDVDI